MTDTNVGSPRCGPRRAPAEPGRLRARRPGRRTGPHAARPRLREDTVLPYALLFPAIALVVITLVAPLFILGNMSIRDVQMGSLEDIFDAPLTTEHLQSVVSDPGTWNSLRVTVIYVIGTTAIAFGLGLGTALLLNQSFRGRRIFRTLILVPWAVPGITATIAFLWMLTPTFGVVNYVLRTLGITSGDINWFADPSTAMFAVIAPTAWKAYPFFTVMLLAGLQAIPRDHYEAAAVDGAGAVARFRYVTWPGIKRYALLGLLFNGMHTFREFDFIYASTRGGPGGATETIAIRIYNEAFDAFRLGSASALGMVTFVIVALAVAVGLARQLRSSSEVAS